MRCRFEEVVEMVMIKCFKSLEEAQEFIDTHTEANEDFVVGVSNGKPAVFCKARRRIYR